MALRICLIDDEKDFTELTGALIGFHGFEAVTINNPVTAWERLQTETFDVVVADIMMPEMDGLTLMQRLRGMKAYASSPLFALSAKRLSETERKFLLTNNIHFVQKPFEPRRLVEMIKESLA